MRALAAIVLALALPGGGLSAQQPPSMTDSIGIELVLIQPGTMQVGVFHPPYPKPVDPGAPVARGRGFQLSRRRIRTRRADGERVFHRRVLRHNPARLLHRLIRGDAGPNGSRWMGTNPSTFTWQEGPPRMRTGVLFENLTGECLPKSS